MIWIIAWLVASAAVTVGALVFSMSLRRPNSPREAGEESTRTRRWTRTRATPYIPVEHLPFLGTQPRDDPEPTEFLTAYVSFEEVARTLDRDPEQPPRVSMQPEPIGLAGQELTPLFDLAVAAFCEWETAMATSPTNLAEIAARSERRWLEQMAMLTGASEAGSHEVFESTLVDRQAELGRRTVACLALLARNPSAALHRIASLVESGDVEASRDALRCWSSHDADASLIEQAKRAGVGARFWLELLIDRMLDPGAELIEELLNSREPESLRLGLGLVCLSQDVARHHEAVERHYFSANAEVRIAAVRAGVFSRDRTAWLHCRQMATDVSAPRATELIAMLGSPQEQDSLLDWGERAAIQGLQVWALALTGRRRAAELASRRLLAGKGDHHTIAGLRHVIGDGRWAEQSSTMSSERRYLVGQFHDASGQRACMSLHGLVHRRALAEELLFRSAGACRLRVHGLAVELLRQLGGLDQLEPDALGESRCR